METEKEKKKIVPQWVSLPLLVAVSAFIIIVFVQDNSYFKSYEYQKEINELNEEIKINNDSADYYSRKARELNTDKETLEKISREQYRMQKPDEDVYITDIK